MVRPSACLLPRRRGSRRVIELRKFLEFVARGAAQLSLRARVVDHEGAVGNRHQTAAETEKSADLQDGVQDAILADDHVVELADIFVLVFGHGSTGKMANAVA